MRLCLSLCASSLSLLRAQPYSRDPLVLLAPDPEPDKCDAQCPALSSVLILRLHRLGLANRLRAIADWHTALQYLVDTHNSSRTLLLDWRPSPECNASWEHLFLRSPLLPLLPEGCSVPHAHALELHELGDAFFLSAQTMTSLSGLSVLSTTYDGALAVDGMPCHMYMSQRARLLRSLVPAAQPSAAVAALLRRFPPSEDAVTVGVHIRTASPTFDWPVVPPLAPSDSEPISFDEGASLAAFASAMRLAEQGFKRANRTARFFLASNSDAAKTTLLRSPLLCLPACMCVISSTGCSLVARRSLASTVAAAGLA